MSSLDHLVYAVPDLAAGVARFAAELGVAAQPGGRHVGRGTANYLVGLGGRSYLEIIGPDPDAAEPDRPRPFGVGVRGEPTLVTWAVATEDLDATLARARAAGYDPGDAAAMSRRTPAGDLLEWRLTPDRVGRAVPDLGGFRLDLDRSRPDPDQARPDPDQARPDPDQARPDPDQARPDLGGSWPEPRQARSDLDPARPDLGGVVPFVIDWGASRHPSEGLDVTLELAELELATPYPEQLRAVLEALDVGSPVTIVQAREPSLRATLAASAFGQLTRYTTVG